MENNLRILDFSRGIRDQEVMFNFNLLYDLLSRERLNVAGYGFLNGLKVEYLYPDEEKQRFKLFMNEGHYINKKGEEVFKQSQDIYLEYFNTVLVVETVSINEDGSINIKDFPYVKNSWELIENDLSNNIKDNITIQTLDPINPINLEVKDIIGKTVVVDSRFESEVKIMYYTAQERYDVITFDNRDIVKYHKGIESNSSSFFEGYEDEIILAIVRYIPHRYPDKKEAILEITQMEELSKRTIWIDQKDGQLYICGVPFDGTQFISIIEPEDPFLNQFWYDMNTNQLKIWREIRGIEQWVVITDNSYMDSTKSKLWLPDELPSDRQFFFFDPVKERELIFAEGTNSLEIIIDNAPLMADQYKEITKSDINDLTKEQRDSIPYDFLTEYLKDDEVSNQYFPQGIGFILKEPLIQDAFVEAKVKHTTRTSVPPKRFERSGTFIDEKRLIVGWNDEQFFTDTNFLKDSNQLSVYLNGVKLTNKIDYDEIEIIESKDGKEKNYCNSFVVYRKLEPSDVLTYRIIGNIMSYDDLSLYMEEVLEYYKDAKTYNEELERKIKKLESSFKEQEEKNNKFKDDVEKKIKELEYKMEEYLKTETYKDSLEDKLINPSIINIEVDRKEIELMMSSGDYKVNIENLKKEHNISIYALLMDSSEDKRIKLIENKDYIINNNNIIFSNASIISNSISIHINGITYSMEGVVV